MLILRQEKNTTVKYMNYINSLILLLLLSVILCSCAPEYKSHDFLLIRINCDSAIANADKEKTIKIVEAAFTLGEEKDFLYKYLTNSTPLPKYAHAYNMLIDQAFEEERFDLAIDKINELREAIYASLPVVAENDYLSTPLVDLYLDSEDSIRIVLSKSFLKIANIIKGKKLSPTEIIGLYSAISSIQDDYKELVTEIIKLPSLVDSVQDGLRTYFKNSNQHLYITNASALKTAHTDRVGNAYLSNNEFVKLNRNQLFYFLAHESYHVASKYTYNLLANNYIEILSKINHRETKEFFDKFPKNLVINLPVIYLFKHTEFDIDAKVLYKFSNIHDSYSDYLMLVQLFSDTNSLEYQLREKALFFAKKYLDNGGSYDSFFAFQLVALSVLVSENDEKGLKEKYGLTPDEFKEVVLNVFFKKNGLKRTKELEDCLFGFFNIKMISLANFINLVKNETY